MRNLGNYLQYEETFGVICNEPESIIQTVRFTSWDQRHMAPQKQGPAQDKMNISSQLEAVNRIQRDYAQKNNCLTI